MALSKRSKQGLAVFSSIQLSMKNVKYLMPQLSVHEKALKQNDRFDIEKAQKEKRNA